METSKQREIENMIIQHIELGKKHKKRTLLARVEKAYESDRSVDVQVINEVINEMIEKGTAGLKATSGDGRTMMIWIESDEKPKPEPGAVELPRAPLHVPAGSVHVEGDQLERIIEDKVVRIQIDEAFAKAIERDTLLVLRDNWLDGKRGVSRADAELDTAKSKLKEAKVALEETELRLAQFGFEVPAETGRADKPKGKRGRKAKEATPNPPNLALFNPKGTADAKPQKAAAE